MKQKIIAVVGPTASGKSDLAVKLAKAFNGEIVSCDSMQIYRTMNIGTAKPTEAEMGGIPHHLLDVADPKEGFSVADYVRLAEKAIDEILARKKLPILCGGTGLYLDRLLSGSDFSPSEGDEALRAELFDYAKKNGNRALHEKLRAVDPESAERIHENNVKRVVRAIEVFTLTGVKKSESDRLSKEVESPYEAYVVGLSYPDRNELVERINRRVDAMMEAGLLEETEALLHSHVFEANQTAAQAIGYKELIPYLRGSCSLQEAVERLKISTRQYAKRQLTWFCAKDYVRWYAPNERNDILPDVGDFLKR